MKADDELPISLAIANKQLEYFIYKYKLPERQEKELRDTIHLLIKAERANAALEGRIELARKVLAVSSGVHKLKGFTQAKRLKLLTDRMMEIIPDNGFGIVEEVSDSAALHSEQEKEA